MRRGDKVVNLSRYARCCHCIENADRIPLGQGLPILIDIQVPDTESYSYFLKLLAEDLKEDVIACKQSQ